MKLSKRLLSAMAFLFILTVSVSAQRGERGDRERSPEKTAERQTARLVEQLELDEAQAEKIKAINMMYAEKTMAARKAAREDEAAEREKMQAQLKPIREAQEAELLKVLTPEQAEKYTEIKNNRGGKGRRGGKGHRGHKGRKLRK